MLEGDKMVAFVLLWSRSFFVVLYEVPESNKM